MLESLMNYVCSIQGTLVISGIVLILSIWLIVEKIKYQKEQYEKRHIHRQYTGRKEDD